MAGMQLQGSKLVSDKGFNKGVTAQITSANSLVTLYTAPFKTRLNSVLVSNELGTILPVELYVYREVDDNDYFVAKTRVLKSTYMVFPQVPGDTRGQAVVINPTANKVGAEIVLQVGDSIKAKCPIEDVINVTLDLREAIK
jgi:hypothetical protein